MKMQPMYVILFKPQFLYHWAVFYVHMKSFSYHLKKNLHIVIGDTVMEPQKFTASVPVLFKQDLMRLIKMGVANALLFFWM